MQSTASLSSATSGGAQAGCVSLDLARIDARYEFCLTGRDGRESAVGRWTAEGRVEGPGGTWVRTAAATSDKPRSTDSFSCVARAFRR